MEDITVSMTIANRPSLKMCMRLGEGNTNINITISNFVWVKLRTDYFVKFQPTNVLKSRCPNSVLGIFNNMN